MGILRDREERIPVTCAVLKESDRDAFFSQIRKNRAGSPEELAKWLAVPVGLINDWISGRLHIPYHTLQNIAYQFSIEMPPVGELRREAMLAAQLPSAKPPEPQPMPPAHSPRTQPQRERAPRAQPQHPKTRKPHKEPPSKKALPKPSQVLAYWAGILYISVQAEGDRLLFRADRKIGQNFAGIWAKKTKELFGISCHLAMKENGKIQEGTCEIPELNDYLARLGLDTDSQAKERPFPRWIWSNPEWTSAYLKGLVDASAGFQRKPALVLEAPPNARHAAQKLLTSLGFKPHLEKAGMLAILGREEVERYFNTIGTENMKLRDQWTSFCRGTVARGHAPASEPAREPAAPTMESTAAPEAPSAAETKPATPAPRKHSRPRRTLYRGRPNQ